jgi:hypothetical protein
MLLAGIVGATPASGSSANGLGSALWNIPPRGLEVPTLLASGVLAEGAARRGLHSRRPCTRRRVV